VTTAKARGRAESPRGPTQPRRVGVGQAGTKGLRDDYVTESVAAALGSEGIDAASVGTELDPGTDDADPLEYVYPEGRYSPFAARSA